MTFRGFMRLLELRRMIIFIIFYEVFQKFSTFGFQSVLFLFLRHEQRYSVYNSVGIYHMYVGMSYLVPVFGTIIADLYMNKVLTILVISVLGVIGQVIVVMAAIAVSGEESHAYPFVTDNTRFFVGIGLFLRALGVGGFRQVGSSLGDGHFDRGDLNYNENEYMKNKLKQFVHYAIVIGMVLAFTIPPALRMNVSCFGNGYCFPLAFGIPGLGTLLVVIVLMAGYRSLNLPRPGDSVTLDFFACITAALYNSCGGGAHWIDNASYAFHNEFLDDVKLTLHVLALYLPLPIFWALFEQMASRWVMQATKMDMVVDEERELYFEPEMIMALNAILVLVLLPLLEYWIYPLCTRTRFIMATVKQRMFVGSLLAVAAFLVAGYIEYRNEAIFVEVAGPGEGDLLVINPMELNITYTLVYEDNLEEVVYDLEPMDLIHKRLPVDMLRRFNVSFYFDYPGCEGFTSTGDPPVPHSLVERRVVGLTISPVGTIPSKPKVPTPCNSPDLPKTDPIYSNFLRCELQLARVGISYFTRRVHGDNTEFDFIYGASMFTMVGKYDWKNRISRFCDPNYSGVDFFDVRAGVYTIPVKNIKENYECRFRRGGVYMIIHNYDTTGACKLLTPSFQSNVTIWYQVPQYLLISFAQYLYPITLLGYSIWQIPDNMKPVLWNFWLISIGLGNVLVAILAFPNIFAREMYYYFMFASLMALNCLLLFILLWNYIPYYPSDRSEDDYDSGRSSSRSAASSRGDSEDGAGPNKRRVRFTQSID